MDPKKSVGKRLTQLPPETETCFLKYSIVAPAFKMESGSSSAPHKISRQIMA